MPLALVRGTLTDLDLLLLHTSGLKFCSVASRIVAAALDNLQNPTIS